MLESGLLVVVELYEKRRGEEKEDGVAYPSEGAAGAFASAPPLEATDVWCAE